MNIIENMKYPSTWQGIVKIVSVIGGLFGWSISPEIAAMVVTGGVSLSGIIDFYWSDSDVKS